jgi:glycosyltransferase involved in cell wall biosynthesis
MSEEQLQITCVIPTHDRPTLLAQSIASVLNQTCEAGYELVVVDDLGQSETEQVIANLMATCTVPIHYVVRDEPKGASASRNVGAHIANGNFLAFLDDDDLWRPHFLEEALNAIRISNADMAISWLSALDSSARVNPMFRMPDSVSVTDAAARNPGLTGSNFLIKKSVFESIGGFDTALPVSNDKDLLVRFLLAGYRYVVVPDFLAIQRQHRGSRLSDHDLRRASGMDLFLRKHSKVLSWRGRRYLRMMIYRSRARSSQSRLERARYLLGTVANLSVADIALEMRRVRQRLQGNFRRVR